MNPELEQISKQALQDLLNNLTQAKGFLIEQAPEFCQQIIAKGMILPLFTGCILAVASVVLSFFTYKLGKWLIEKDDGTVLLLLPPAFGVVMMLVTTITNFYQALSVYIAPTVYLVEQLSGMIK